VVVVIILRENQVMPHRPHLDLLLGCHEKKVYVYVVLRRGAPYEAHHSSLRLADGLADRANLHGLSLNGRTSGP
jgi:hypothetical protein